MGLTVFNMTDISVPGPVHNAVNILNWVDSAKKLAPIMDHKMARKVFICLLFPSNKRLFPSPFSFGLSTPMPNMINVNATTPIM